MVIGGQVEVLDPENKELIIHTVENNMQEGWWYMVWVSGKWEPFKFATFKKERRAEALLKVLNRKYHAKFTLTRGWTTITTGEQNETEKETGPESESI